MGAHVAAHIELFKKWESGAKKWVEKSPVENGDMTATTAMVVLV